jgi:hypothetical protein
MIWIPQQLFQFRPAPPGVWTISFHHNDWTPRDTAAFREDLKRYGPNISSLDEVLPHARCRTSRLSARISTLPRLSRFMLRCELKLWEKAHLRPWKTSTAPTPLTQKPMARAHSDL